MTRSGTARLRILVDTKRGQSIQLSVSDADVQELLAARRSQEAAAVPLDAAHLTALLAGGVGWVASSLLAAKPQILPPPPGVEAAAPRRCAASHRQDSAAESLPLPRRRSPW